MVEKDKSLEGFVDSGFIEFGPLIAFRDWLAQIRNDPEMRTALRRSGRYTVTGGGTFVPGPFTLQARAKILRELRKVEAKVCRQLITDDEIDRIQALWAAEASADRADGHLWVIDKEGGA